MRKSLTHILWAITGTIIIGAALFFTAIWNGWIGGEMLPVEELENQKFKYASQILSADGELLGTWSYSENRMFAGQDEIAPCVFQALVATEDKRFYEHSGIDLRSLLRAVVKRGIFQQHQAGGGSTITQQLAKQLYTKVADNSLERVLQKTVEWTLALKIEHYYSKDEILTLYLNYFDFLHSAVGIRSAAKIYFNKDASELTVPEAAMLIGMCKNPSYFNPISHAERVLERRNTVLELMMEQGYITELEAEAYKKQDLGLNYHVVSHNEGYATYFREYLRIIMMAEEPIESRFSSRLEYEDAKYEWENNPLYGWCNKNEKDDGSAYNIYTDGLKIYTTIDSRMQKYAEQAVREHLGGYLQREFNREKRGTANYPYASDVSSSDRTRWLESAMKQTDRYRNLKAEGYSDSEIRSNFNTKTSMTVFTYHGDVDTTMTPMDSIIYHKAFLQAGMLSMDPSNGYVKAYVGGIDLTHFKYDMCSKAHRQVGSTIKPYLYALAMENGMTPCTTAPNEQRTYGDWTPRNGSRARYGEMVELRWGLAMSNNWISAYLIDYLRPGPFVEWLHSFGYLHRLDPNYTLCLGACEFSVKEMVAAYTAFANNGIRVSPVMVTKIEDSNGKVIARFNTTTKGVMSSASSYRMLDMMKGVIDQGTGRRLRSTYGITAQVAGKTGTTQKNSDGWFMGVTPRLVTGCWVGGENRNIRFNSTAMGQGASMALPIWGKYMKKVYNDRMLGYSEGEAFKIPIDFNMCGGDDEFLTDSISLSNDYEIELF